MANYLATNEKAGTGAIMTVSIDFKGVDPDVGSGAVPYINVADVKAEIVTPATQTTGESSVAVGLTNIGPTTFRTNAVVPIGKILRIYRSSQDAYGLVQFQALQNVTEKDLDLLARQILYVAMETKDLAARAGVAGQYSDTLARLALTTAGTAVNTAGQAVQTANAAVLAASSAVSTANDAYTRSNQAIQTANAAVANVQDALEAANDATAAAEAATQAAQQAVEDAQNAVREGTERFLQPSATAPALRDDGTPLETGDRYLNTATGIEFIYQGNAWVANNLDGADIANNSDPAKGAALVGWDGGTVADVLGGNRVFSSYADLGSYFGLATRCYISDPLTAGHFVRSGTAAADGGVYLKDALGRTWIRVISGPVHAEWYGAQPFLSGTGNDALAAFTAAANYCRANNRALTASGRFRLSDSLNLRNIRVEMGRVEFRIDSGPAGWLILGGSSNIGENPDQYVGKVRRVDNSNTIPSVRVIGAKNQRIRIDWCRRLQLYASTSSNDSGSLAYSTFDLNYVVWIEYATDPANAGGPSGGGIGSSEQWINENIFNLNRVTGGLLMDGSYRHNHNLFIGGSWENEITINIQVGNKNHLKHCRLEAGPTTIIFGEQTGNNWIENTWDGGNEDTPSALASGSIIDLGVSNVVSDDFGSRRNTTCVASVTIADPIVANRVGELVSRQPHLQRIGGAGGNQPMLYTDYLPIEQDMFFYFLYAGHDAGDTSLYRPRLEFFDKNMVPINAALSWIYSNAWANVSGNTLSTTAGQTFSYATVAKAALDAGAAFVRATSLVSSSQTANALARRLQIFCSYKHGASYQGAAPAPRQQDTVVTRKPIAGFAPLGYRVYNDTNGEIYSCSFSLSTVSTAPAAQGATSVTLATTAGIAVGDVIGVNVNNRNTHWSAVTAVSGSTVTFALGLEAQALQGTRVVFTRWATLKGA